VPNQIFSAACARSAWRILAVVVLLSAPPSPMIAGSVVEAYVEVINCGFIVDRGPIGASASNMGVDTTGSCANRGAEASGGASFLDGIISLSMTSIPQRGVSGYAYLNDHLTFQVPGGGSAQVQVTIAGSWGGTYDFSTNADFQVQVGLGLGGVLYQGRGYANLAYDDGLPVSDSFVGTDIGGGVILGSYSFTTMWTVYDGVDYEFFAGLHAQAVNGATSYIDDPLVIVLPAGVTYTSGSGRIYTPVPEPSSALLLLGVALAAAGRRLVKRRA
jgi:hypothetical protein